MMYHKATIIPTFTLILSIGLAESPQSPQRSELSLPSAPRGQLSSTQGAPLSERNAIYSAAINYLYDKVYPTAGVKLIVISNKTDDQQELKPQLNLKTKYELASKNVLDDLLYNQDKDAFSRRYKTAPGYMVLSGISISADGSQAELTIDLECGFLCGTGRYFSLARAGGKWAVKEQKVTWQK